MVIFNVKIKKRPTIVIYAVKQEIKNSFNSSLKYDDVNDSLALGKIPGIPGHVRLLNVNTVAKLKENAELIEENTIIRTDYGYVNPLYYEGLNSENVVGSLQIISREFNEAELRNVALIPKLKFSTEELNEAATMAKYYNNLLVEKLQKEPEFVRTIKEFVDKLILKGNLNVNTTLYLFELEKNIEKCTKIIL